MEKLDECPFKQGLATVVNINIGIGTDSRKAEVVVLGKNENIEKNNFRTAQKLKDAKSKLINALAKFPITALWLLNEYEQNCNKTTNEQFKESSELALSLEAVKKLFESSSASFALKNWATTSSFSDDIYHLNIELGRFPYTFEDLVKLVDVIVFAYKYRELSYQPINSSNNPNADIVIKRLVGMGRRTRISAAKFYDLVKVSSEQYDEQFLFLTASEMQKYFSDVVLSEHDWLNARQQLTTANTKLVLYIANQYKGSFLGFDDLVQEGQVGLLKAVDRFDHRLGFQFSTYAGYWIKQSISRALSKSERSVRVPCGQVANINRVFRAKEELYSKTGTEVSVKELAEYTKFTKDEINTILSISQSPLPLENFDAREEEKSYAPIDFLEQQVFPHPLIKIAETELENLLAKALKMLSSREEKIICCHFGINCENEMTLQDIGSELNLTRERVRQIQVKALNMLKLYYGNQLMSFL
ncbi:MAG: sigma-70 family RNA polymerase sigma factor [Methylococcaceae bacterium]|nr:sigma-70 family RNA polymerase sigma factor [Methylococcaceae bacterium]